MIWSRRGSCLLLKWSWQSMCKGRLQYIKNRAKPQDFDRFSFFVIRYHYTLPFSLFTEGWIRHRQPPYRWETASGSALFFFFSSSHIVFSLTWTLGDNIKQGGSWLRLIWVSALSKYKERETSHAYSITVEIFHITYFYPHTQQRPSATVMAPAKICLLTRCRLAKATSRLIPVWWQG